MTLPRSLIALLALLLAATSASGEVRVSGSIDPQAIGVGESAVMTITIEGASSVEGKPSLRSPDGLRIREGGESRSFSLVNGRLSQSIQQQYILTPLREGEFAIGPFEVRVSGRAYQIGPLRLSAVSGGGAGPSTPRSAPPSGGGQREEDRSTPPIAVEMIVDPDDPYVGEQITARISFLRRYDASVLDARFVPPDTEGFWREEMPPERRSRRERGGTPYEATDVLLALFPTRAGDLKISPAAVQVRYRDPRARGGYDPFSFFGFRGAEREAEIPSKACAVRVRSLPPGAPSSFAGAVGDYEIRASLDRDTAIQGEPVTWIVEIVGEGNIAALEGPRFPEVVGCRGYEAGSEAETTRGNDRIGGRKRFSRVLVPEIAGSLSLPSIEWAYFDPKEERYRVVETSRRTVRVEPAKAGTGDLSTERLGGAIRGSRTRTRLTPLSAERPWTRTGFWLLQAIPVAGLAGSLALRRRREERRRDPEGFRMRRAPRRLREALRSVAAETEDPWGMLARSLESYLADRYGAEVRGMTRESLGAHLVSRGAPSEIAQRLSALLARADSLRYTPATDQAAAGIHEAVREVLECAARLGRRDRG